MATPRSLGTVRRTASHAGSVAPPFAVHLPTAALLGNGDLSEPSRSRSRHPRLPAPPAACTTGPRGAEAAIPPAATHGRQCRGPTGSPRRRLRQGRVPALLQPPEGRRPARWPPTQPAALLGPCPLPLSPQPCGRPVRGPTGPLSIRARTPRPPAQRRHVAGRPSRLTPPRAPRASAPLRRAGGAQRGGAGRGGAGGGSGGVAAVSLRGRHRRCCRRIAPRGGGLRGAGRAGERLWPWPAEPGRRSPPSSAWCWPC